MNLSIFSFKPQAVPLPNGETAHLSRMSAIDRVAWINSLSAATQTEGDRDLADALDSSAELLILCLCTADGERMIAAGDVETVKAFDSEIFDLLAKAAADLNGLSAKGKEQVEGESNGGGSPSTSSPSSPAA